MFDTIFITTLISLSDSLENRQCAHMLDIHWDKHVACFTLLVLGWEQNIELIMVSRINTETHYVCVASHRGHILSLDLQGLQQYAHTQGQPNTSTCVASL